MPRRRELVRRLAELIEREASRHPASGSRKAWVNRCGYHLYDVLKEGQLDLARLLVGSEGTLALITQATLRTEPIPKHRGVDADLFRPPGVGGGRGDARPVR